MPTNRLLVAASLLYAAPGIALLFAGDVVLRHFDTVAPPFAQWVAGMLGATLVALALLNWFQRHTIIGGIFGRPLLMANVMTLSNATFASLRMWRSEGAAVYAAVGVLSALLLIGFGRSLFRGPSANPLA